jgi:acyl-coenzyme A synthetase/AMP-(fatty) acid ligase
VAFVRLQPGALPVELDAVQRALGDGGLPRTKWIEGLRVVEDFPRTPSGKIRKFVLRDELRRDEHES